MSTFFYVSFARSLLRRFSFLPQTSFFHIFTWRPICNTVGLFHFLPFTGPCFWICVVLFRILLSASSASCFVCHCLYFLLSPTVATSFQAIPYPDLSEHAEAALNPLCCYITAVSGEVSAVKKQAHAIKLSLPANARYLYIATPERAFVLPWFQVQYSVTSGGELQELTTLEECSLAGCGSV